MEHEFNDSELLHHSPESEAENSRQLDDVIHYDYFSVQAEKKKGSEVGEGTAESEPDDRRSGSIEASDVEDELGCVGNRENLVSVEGGKEFGSEGEARGELWFDSGGDGGRSLGKVEGSAEGLADVGGFSGGSEESEIVLGEFDGENGLGHVSYENEVVSSGFNCKFEPEKSDIVRSEFECKIGLDSVTEKSEIVLSEFDGKTVLDRVLEKSEFDGKIGLDHIMEKSEIISSEVESGLVCFSEKSEIISSEVESGLFCFSEKSEIISSEVDGRSGSDHVSVKSEIVSGGLDGKSDSDSGLEGECVKFDEGQNAEANEMEIRGEVEKRRVMWWKIPLDFLKNCMFKFNPVLSFSVAAALMGVVILGRRLYKMKRRSRLLELKVMVDDKKVSQFMSRAERLNEAFSVVRRVPIIRPSIPASGVGPWPAMSLR